MSDKPHYHNNITGSYCICEQARINGSCTQERFRGYAHLRLFFHPVNDLHTNRSKCTTITDMRNAKRTSIYSFSHREVLDTNTGKVFSDITSLLLKNTSFLMLSVWQDTHLITDFLTVWNQYRSTHVWHSKSEYTNCTSFHPHYRKNNTLYVILSSINYASENSIWKKSGCILLVTLYTAVILKQFCRNPEAESERMLCWCMARKMHPVWFLPSFGLRTVPSMSFIPSFGFNQTSQRILTANNTT